MIDIFKKVEKLKNLNGNKDWQFAGNLIMYDEVNIW